jgi:hypothetical protein
MSGKRTELRHLCDSLFSNCGYDDFIKTLHNLQVELAEVAANGQYTILSYAQGLMDEHLDRGRVDSEYLTIIADVFPVKLSACMTNLCQNRPELATALANNIVRHEDFHSDSCSSIQEAITGFVECGYPEQATIILEGLLTTPYGYADFDHSAFVGVLHDAFEQGSDHIIQWAIDNEEKLLSTELRHCSSEGICQYHGNMLFKKGLKKLGSLIMERKPGGASGVELFEREIFTGLGINPISPQCREHDPVVSYMLGTPALTHEWFATDLVNISGDHLANVEDLRNIDVVVPNERIELVASIMIATSKNIDNINSVFRELAKQKVIIDDELLTKSLSQAMPKVWNSINRLLEFNKICSEVGVTIDYSRVAEKIEAAVVAWEGSSHSDGDLLGYMHSCSDGFPLTAKRLAQYVDDNWARWNPKQRNVLHENAPKNISRLSTYLKGMQLEDAIGL